MPIFQPELETLPRPQLKALQDERLREQVHYVYARVPFYRQRLDEAGIKPGDIRGVEDLPKLPFTRKKDLREHYPFGMFAVGREELARIHASSGTTGKPTVVGYTRGDLEVFAEVVARSLAAAGGEPGMMLHNAYGYGLFTGGLGLHGGAEKLGMLVVPVSGGMTERQIMLIQDFKPEMISCTPSYAQTLAEEFKKRGVAPEEISLKYAVLGAEPWTEAIRKSVEEGLGVRATNIYGLSEIIGPGVSNEDVHEREGLSYIWEDHFYPEIVHPETGEPLPEGETGVLVLTTLTKKAMPILRYWTGDLTFITREPAPSGRTHARMGQIRGRTDDMLIIRGVNVYPTQIEEVLKGIAEVEPHYQIVVSRQGTLDEVELKVELAEGFYRHIGAQMLSDEVVEADHQLSALRDKVAFKIKDNVGVSVKVSLLSPGTAPRSEGGKLKRVADLRRLS
ncbi:Phenylacetate--CoA ligase [Allomeiothermus silvanus DSM 9946]|uniref:Phenylacetate-coenzyme A ligase n=1 Tax=Allomeiothermus silvanus (strain ATCC 700542 / DSM 9946 / NBRC 106475 / NCIMB 13440 / VI-R2) TaxID=526227 RepID=D7BIK6_ALLS1|nr:Phenylacetate--CoA ligase [Allomeiothermus silvanus DSM 9946]